ncbi:MAG: class I SAM-dependent methyltransferase [Rhodospirillales bacterium]|nr:class I SAM-dependent methyltransferase [Rhodospirillales bacterium]MDP6590981.1 class I SAM-dependent methyltransferase [Alphaproteobacteria bacterium]MDP6842953.1 class I SAM-dependent methyltransferase [Rhodospirillales bacterium]
MDESKPYWGQILARYVPNVVFYALAREMKPKVIVETGTSYGGGTMFLLAAIHKNGIGRVLSIDIPPSEGALTMEFSLARSKIGSFIPEFLKAPWEYLEGDAKLLLPRVLAEEDADMFIHDSLHTATHMAFEFAVARALMRHKTLIATDDLLWNIAFDSFLATHQLTGYASIDYPNTGVTVNLFSEEEREIGTGIVMPN